MTDSTSLRVLHLVANRWWTGSADPVIRLVGGLEKRGHRVWLALIAGDRFEAKAREAGIEPVAGLSLDVKAMPWSWLADWRRLRALVRREQIDLVHVHHSHDHWLGAACRGSAALARTFHNQRAVRLGRVARALYRRADAVLAVSGQIAERVRLAGVAARPHPPRRAAWWISRGSSRRPTPPPCAPSWASTSAGDRGRARHRPHHRIRRAARRESRPRAAHPRIQALSRPLSARAPAPRGQGRGPAAPGSDGA